MVYCFPFFCSFLCYCSLSLQVYCTGPITVYRNICEAGILICNQGIKEMQPYKYLFHTAYLGIHIPINSDTCMLGSEKEENFVIPYRLSEI